MRKAVFAFLMVFSLAARAAKEISIQLDLDNPNVSVGEEINLQINVTGVRSSDPPQLLNTHGFEYQVTGTSSQVSIINGDTTRSINFSAVLVPTTAGDFQIGPAQVEIDGKPYQSNAIRIHVGKGAGVQNSVANNFKIESFVATKTPYVYQQVLYTFRFLSRGNLGDARVALPDFKGFFKENLGNERRYQKTIDGLPWQVTEIQYALFPSSSGEITVSAATLEAEVEMESNRPQSRFDSFFNDSFFRMGRGQTKRLRLRAEPIVMNVQALPATGKPANFSGLVGKFHATSSLSKNQVAAGESATLSVVVEGEGNIRDANLPEIKWPDFKIYDDEPNVRMTSSTDKISGVKTFKKALVPLNAGAKTIPALAINYFDPFEKAYKAATTAPLALNVTPGTGTEMAHTSANGNGLEKKDVQVQGEDLMPLKRVASLGADTLSRGESRIGWIIFALGPLAFLLSLLYEKRRQRILGDEGYHRRSKAYKNFAAQLEGKALDYDALSNLLRRYLGDKLTFDGTALTPLDAERKLQPFKIPEATVKDVKAFLNECERGSYGGGSVSADKQTELRQKLTQIVGKLEKEISV